MLQIGDEYHLQVFTDRRRCSRIEPSTDDTAPSMFIVAPTGELQPGSTQADCEEQDIGTIADVTDIIPDADAKAPGLLVDSATYCVELNAAVFASLGDAKMEYFGFKSLDEKEDPVVDRTFEVPASELWLGCGLAGAYMAAWFEFEQHTLHWNNFEPELSLFFQALSPVLKKRLIELPGYKDFDDLRLKFMWRCVALAGLRCRHALDLQITFCEMKAVRDHHRENPSDMKRTEAPLHKAALLDARPKYQLLIMLRCVLMM